MNPKVLFLCTGNSCRSQMAEGWARHLLKGRFDAYSAGTEPHGLNAFAVKAMKESGVDISGHTSKVLESFGPMHFDLVVTVCDSAAKACPTPPKGTVRVIHAPFDDPPRLAQAAKTEEEAMGHYRRVRDEIRAFVETLPSLWDGDKVTVTGAELIPQLLRRFPKFDDRWQKHAAKWKGEEPGLCYDMTEFARFVEELIRSKQSEDLQNIADTVEELICEGDRDVVYAVTIGFLEDLLNFAGKDETFRDFAKLLKPKSLAFCKECEQFWGTKAKGVTD